MQVGIDVTCMHTIFVGVKRKDVSKDILNKIYAKKKYVKDMSDNVNLSRPYPLAHSASFHAAKIF